MKKELFNDNWLVVEKKGMFGMPVQAEPTRVTLPYDAMIFTRREEGAPYASASYPLGKWEYKKSWFVPKEWEERKVYLQFDGVYQNALVYVNGDCACCQNNGYVPFVLDVGRYLNYGAENEVTVIVHLADGARWYSGAGIYRDVLLLTGNLLHVVPHGVKIHTPSVCREMAEAHVRTTVRNDSARAKVTVRVRTEIVDEEGVVAAFADDPLTVLQKEEATTLQKLYVAEPKLWDVDVPRLYTCKTMVYMPKTDVENVAPCVPAAGAAGTVHQPMGEILDENEETFGIRYFRLNPREGLVMNGRPIKLAGAGLHHENGPAGAISLDCIEERKIARLKESGFNAIRTAHNPPSPALLRACDKLGMLVMEELFDTWTHGKVDFDNTLTFQTTWEKDVEAVVEEAYNHPSVLMYSIGNEIADTGSANGAVLGRKIVEKLRGLDGTRYIINCVNGMVSVMGIMEKMWKNSQEAVNAPSQDGQNAINGMMGGLGDTMRQVMLLDEVTNFTEESFSAVDIAGYNYMDSRYGLDQERFPNRVICGTETFIPDIDTNWEKVMKYPHVIGDFCWTGWDYVGEPSTGLVKYEAPPLEYGMGCPYPASLSQVGEFTISGNKRTCSYYHEIILGRRKGPFLAMYRPERYASEPIYTPWSWSDTVRGYSFEGYEGKPALVEVYADADEVELLVNGKSLGRKPIGRENRHKVVFDFTYEPGELRAVAYADGNKIGEDVLRSAVGTSRIHAVPEKREVSLDERELIYLSIAVTGENGEVYIQNRTKIMVEPDGGVEWLGYGTDDPLPEENFVDHERTLYDGRAIAVFRPTKAGTVRFTLSGEGLEAQVVEVQVRKGANDEC